MTEQLTPYERFMNLLKPSWEQAFSYGIVPGIFLILLSFALSLAAIVGSIALIIGLCWCILHITFMTWLGLLTIVGGSILFVLGFFFVIETVVDGFRRTIESRPFKLWLTIFAHLFMFWCVIGLMSLIIAII